MKNHINNPIDGNYHDPQWLKKNTPTVMAIY